MLETIEPIQRLDKDLRQAAKLLGKREARYMVDAYYIAQDNRMRADARVRECSEQGEPNRLLMWEAETHRRVEDDVRKALDTFSSEYTVGRWAKSIVGIGPVISAGLLAHLDITQAPTCCHFWRFAGLDPSTKWDKGTRRPWNAQLKSLVAFKLGECFVKVQNNPNDYYGKMFRERRDLEEAKNTTGGLAGQAASVLEAKNIGKTTEAFKAYSAGRLPPAHLHARARRYTVKLFLSHLHHVMFSDWFGSDPPKPYAFTENCNGDHRHYIPPPNWPFSDPAKSLKELI